MYKSGLMGLRENNKGGFRERTFFADQCANALEKLRRKKGEVIFFFVLQISLIMSVE